MAFANLFNCYHLTLIGSLFVACGSGSYPIKNEVELRSDTVMLVRADQWLIEQQLLEKERFAGFSFVGFEDQTMSKWLSKPNGQLFFCENSKEDTLTYQFRVALFSPSQVTLVSENIEVQLVPNTWGEHQTFPWQGSITTEFDGNTASQKLVSGTFLFEPRLHDIWGLKAWVGDQAESDAINHTMMELNLARQIAFITENGSTIQLPFVIAQNRIAFGARTSEISLAQFLVTREFEIDVSDRTLNFNTSSVHLEFVKID